MLKQNHLRQLNSHTTFYLKVLQRQELWSCRSRTKAKSTRPGRPEKINLDLTFPSQLAWWIQFLFQIFATKVSAPALHGFFSLLQVQHEIIFLANYDRHVPLVHHSSSSACLLQFLLVSERFARPEKCIFTLLWQGQF